MKKVIQRYFDMEKVIQRYLDMEPAGGILLIFTAGLAIVIANSAFQGHYESLLNLSLAGMSLHHWINDGLMAIFFLQIGLEVKQELLEGELKERETAIFPAIAAIGGMVVPAGIYLLINTNDAIAIQGWAIPAATDIAFALGIISLLGARVPSSLKMFLLALAIIDDLGVIVIIAVFYNSDVSIVALSVAFAMTALLIGMNFYRVTRIGAYLLVGAVLWVAMLKSGVHATLAGVIVGLVIPLKGKEGQDSPLNTLEYRLHPYVAFLILPIFAFANAGLSFDAMSLDDFMHPIPLGVACGLFLGKPLGVFIFSWCAVKTGIAKLPEGIQLKHIFAVSVLCGIGFTMSIFISSLAFAESNIHYDTYARIGILTGSVFAAVIGYLLLRLSLPKPLKI